MWPSTACKIITKKKDWYILNALSFICQKKDKVSLSNYLLQLKIKKKEQIIQIDLANQLYQQGLQQLLYHCLHLHLGSPEATSRNTYCISPPTKRATSFYGFLKVQLVSANIQAQNDSVPDLVQHEYYANIQAETRTNPTSHSQPGDLNQFPLNSQTRHYHLRPTDNLKRINITSVRTQKYDLNNQSPKTKDPI